MKKRLIAMLLCISTMLSLCTSFASAAGTVEEALGEVDIYNGGYKMYYLSINGRIQEQNYTYYNYVDSNGKVREIPAYCVNPTTKGVPQTVAAGESIEYLAEEKTSDPKVLGIIANGYPTRGLSELKLENKYQAFYATKMALWCYLLSHWDINNLKVNPNLTGVELERAQKILTAAKNIYARGITWNELLAPEVTCTPDKSVAYDVTIDGKAYKQQVFTFWSKTWVCDYDVQVSFSVPDDVPEGTRIVDMNNRDITALKTDATGDGYAAQFKVLYPAESIAGETGSVQLSFRTNVYKYAVYFAICAEQSKYGTLQNYVVDTDPTTVMSLSALSNYSADNEVEDPETGLEILKYETDTEIPLSGALFEVIDPDGATVGTFATNNNGQILLPVTLSGNYTVIERQAPTDHLLSQHTAQNVTVEYGKVATVTFFNDPYGTLRIEKKSDTGDNLPGAVIRVEHIKSGKVYTATTNSAGCAIFTEILPGAYRIQEQVAPSGWQLNDTVYTASVETGETTTVAIVNKELPGLRIIKHDRVNQKAMADVTFEVWRDTISLGKFRTDEFGEILLTDLTPGTYCAVEVDTGNDGYILDTTPQEVELEAGKGIRELVFFNDQKPGLRLVKVDSADPSKVIANAVFEIKAVDGSYGPEEFTTDKNGEIDLSKLPTGAYVVTEKSCPGYVIDEAQRIIQLDANENAQFIFTNSIKPTLNIIKHSSDGTRLPGVAFRIAKIEDGSRYLDRTTDSTGEIKVSDLEPGVYSVKETATTAEHIIDIREYHVELFAGKTSTLVVENQKRPNLIVYKHDAVTGEPIANTVFEVRAADGHSVDELRTDSAGRAELKNLLPGVYEITEKSVPSNYLLDAPSQLVTLYPNRDHTVYFENHQKPNLTVNKICSVTGDPLEGAKFQVFYASNATESGEVNDLGYFYTDADGQFQITNLKDGWYKITELEPVPGYAIKEPATQELFIKAGESKTVTFENTPLSALVIFKYDSVTGEAVQNAVFQVKYLTGTSGSGGTVIGTYKTSVNGSFTVTGLKEGTYVVEELASDSGHVIDTAPQTAYISGKNQDVVQLYFGNSPKGSLLVKKVDASNGKPLADVEFMVTTDDGTVVGNANGKYVTDSSGSFVVENLAPGTSLVVKETRAKDGYILDDAPQTVRIKSGETVALEFRNQPKGSLVIHKLDSVTKKPLEGVKFEIAYSDGSYVDDENGKLSSKGLYTTDSNGQISISGIVGTLVVTEVETLDGYTIDEETRTQTVVVNPNDTQTLTFYNQPVGGVEIIKVDAADTTKRIAGVTFEIRKAGNDMLVDTVSTDANGRIFLSLEDGDYYAVEIEATEGYKLDDTHHTFEVKDGKTTTLRIKNTAVSGILIHKISSTTGKGIPGVSFLLYDRGKNPIGEYVSDQRGYVYIDDLPSAGRYYLRELENEGYLPDTELKTVYVKSGETTEVTWKNTPITGQIQITKTSADYNSVNGWPAGTALPGTVFEIYDKANNLVDTVKTNKNGIAISQQLPLGRYKVVEVQSTQHYGLDSTPMEAEIEFSGQIVRMAMTNKSLYTNVSITKRGYVEVMPGQMIRYDFSGIANNSTTSLTSFYWRDTLPTQAVRLDKIITGTYNVQGNYKVVFKTNLSNEYRTLADNLLTGRNYVLNASPSALGLAANECVTEFMFVFGIVPANFRQVEAPQVYCTVNSGLVGGSQFTNQADVGGVYNGQWIMATDRWVTKVYQPAKPLPRTGY